MVSRQKVAHGVVLGCASMPSSISSITSGDSELAVPIFSSGKFEDDELDAACFAELSISLQVKEPAAGTPPPQHVLRQGSHTEAMRHDPGQELAIFQQRAQQVSPSAEVPASWLACCLQLGDLACTWALQASQEEQERADAAVAAFMFGVSEQADRQAVSLQPPEAASSSTAHGDVVAPDDILAQMDTPSRKQAARGQGCVHQSNASIVDWPGNPGVDCRALHTRNALRQYTPAAWALSTVRCLRHFSLVAAPAASCLAAYWPEPERVLVTKHQSGLQQCSAVC